MFQTKLPKFPALIAFATLAMSGCAEDGTSDSAALCEDVRGDSALSDAAQAALADSARELRTLAIDNDYSDLEGLAAQLAGKSVVALGEATHGTKEFNQARARLIHYLVASPEAQAAQETPFTVFILEDEYAASTALRDYLIDGRGTAEAGLAALRGGTWKNRENLAMFEALRAFNAQNPDRAITFYGADMQDPLLILGSIPALAAKYQINVDAQLASLQSGIEAIIGHVEALMGAVMADEEPNFTAVIEHRNRLTAEVDALEAALQEGITALGSQDTREARRDLYTMTVLRQSLIKTDPMAIAYALLEGDPRREVYLQKAVATLDPADIPPDPFYYRDVAMAENIAAIMDIEGPNARVFFWAHNYHIANQLFDDRAAGGHLRERFGDAYYAIATDFYRGSFQAVNRTGTKQTFSVDSSDTRFLVNETARLCAPYVYLDFATAMQSGDLRPWLVAPRAMHFIPADYDPERAEETIISDILPAQWDAMLVIHETTATEDL